MQTDTQQDEARTELHRYNCEECGATLQYAPGTQVLRCDYCGHENAIAVADAVIEEKDFRRALAELADAGTIEASITNHCDSCGAEYTYDPDVHAGECPFCGAPTVAATETHRHIQASALLPFQVDAKQARGLFKGWLKGLWFAPTKLKQYGRGDTKITGMYVPYWTYDAATASTYQGSRGDYYQVPETYQTVENGRTVTRTRMVTKVRWTPVAGRVSRFFDDVLVLASEALPRQITERLEPWDLKNLQPYRTEYLSGFRSEMYQVDLGRGFEYAREIMAGVIRSDVARDIGGDLQRISYVDTRYGDISFKHILLPIWMSAFRFRDKSYRFIVNARTGEVQGERPYSAWKIALAVIVSIILAGAGAMAWMAMQGQQVPY